MKVNAVTLTYLGHKLSGLGLKPEEERHLQTFLKPLADKLNEALKDIS